MKVTGSAVVRAPREDVWKALNDPAVLVRTIPGCERLEEDGPDAYRMVVTAGVASIKGAYAGSVRLTDQDPPATYVLHATGAGAPGTVTADVRVTLADDGGATRVDYDADAVVGGPVGGVGQRMLAGVARRTATEFFGNVERAITGGDQPVPTAGAVAPAGEAAEAQGTATAAPGVYLRPPSAGGTDRSEFLRGAVFGAAVALLGALVGGFVARSRR